MDLRQYLYKIVEVISDEGKKYIGYVGLYESSYDSGYDEPSIGIKCAGSNVGIEFLQSEIKSIKILEK